VITERLANILKQAVLAAREAGELNLTTDDFTVKLEMPPSKQFGDYSSNLALTLRKSTNLADSRAIAEIIRRHIEDPDKLIDRVEVAGPGFLNLFLNPDWLYGTLVRIEELGKDYGRSQARVGQKILLEFVSANPTGPISVVNGRAAALGDVLANLFAAEGAEVHREFYVNDALNSLQLELFARTVKVRYLQELGYPIAMPEGDVESEPQSGDASKPIIPFPSNGYLGEYVRDIARRIVEEIGNRYETTVAKELLGDEETASSEAEERDRYFREATLRIILELQRQALEAFGVFFDRWFFESSLYESGAVDEVIRLFTERGYTYRKDGALWLRTSAFGDDEDRVLVRSNEKATYIAADAAYHRDKFERGFTHLVDIFGADHHGYVARLRASIAALGYPVDRLYIILTQMVSLMRDGEAIIGGKRKGAIIELKEDLVDEIGRDAARFYFLLNSYETPATVDVELAKRQSNENPVYYVQYAHARLCSILRRAEEMGIAILPAAQVDRNLLTHPRELDVLRKLADYPEEVATASERFAPHRLTRYAIDLASLLNLFYENCRVLPNSQEEPERSLVQARLALVNCARIVLNNLLGLLGVSAPERMERADNNAAEDGREIDGS
jgi:arginyl-tRNA synthetase